MALVIRVSHADHFMSAKISGAAFLKDMLELIETLSDEAIRTGARRLQLDLRGVDQDLKLTEHIMLSEHAVAKFGHLERVASIVKPGSRRGTSEHIAQQRGVQLRVFTTEEEASAWMKQAP